MDRALGHFGQYLQEHEYRSASISQYMRIADLFQSWVAGQRGEVAKSLPELVAAYLDSSAAIDGRPRSFHMVRAALHRYMEWMALKPPDVAPPSAPDAIALEVQGYLQYLRDVAGLALATCLRHRTVVEQFLRTVATPQIIPHSEWLTVSKVEQFIITQWAHLQPISKKGSIGVIRGYARYLRFRGVAFDLGILRLPLAAPVWKLASVPQTLTQADIDRLLESYLTDTATGCRDWAIAVCFVDLGLRASEVANLALDDFEWRAGRIRIRASKTRQERVLPLPQRVGDAVARYLTGARPSTPERTLFVRFAHQAGQPMGREQIRGTIRRAYARAGFSSHLTGTHVLRHTKAAALYHQGSDLKVIADILGHTSIDTTVIYTKVAGPALAPVQSPWPGARPEGGAQ
ncbi:MAG: site-specific integrase [Thermaerobacter sp.]|nr:site-specific integrase [Thermaerobacter sp.]